MATYVQIVHPDLPGQSARVTKRSYDAAWKARGWKIGKPSRRSATKKETE